MIYVYFYENIFQDKSIHIVFIFPNSNNLKVIYDFIFLIFNPNLVQNDFHCGYGGSIF